MHTAVHNHYSFLFRFYWFSSGLNSSAKHTSNLGVTVHQKDSILSIITHPPPNSSCSETNKSIDVIELVSTRVLDMYSERSKSHAVFIAYGVLSYQIFCGLLPVLEVNHMKSSLTLHHLPSVSFLMIGFVCMQNFRTTIHALLSITIHKLTGLAEGCLITVFLFFVITSNSK